MDATERGIEILDKLLDVTRSAFGEEFQIVRQSLDVGQLGAKLVQEMTPISRGRTIALRVRGDTTGQFDGARLGQLFSNLIGNAIQYSTPNSEISVCVRGQEQNVLISVHNLGDPIPQGKARTIFQSMTRGISERPDAGASPSLGLGLFIARNIVAAHGGELSVSSSSEEGTTFTALLPRQRVT